MEATAKHDFNATSDDELSFRKSDKLKIINMEEDQNWYRAELRGKQGWIPTNYIQVEQVNWFVGKMTRNLAEQHLLEKTENKEFLHPDGAFVVRHSESSPEDFSLSVKFNGGVQHFKVLRDGAGKYFLWVVKFDSLNDLVKYHKEASVSRTHTVYLQERVTKKRLANYDYVAGDREELSIKRGDLITVLNTVDNEWWEGELERDGKRSRGLFPKVYTSEFD